MASQLERADVERIAELARLTVAAEDAPRYAEQLNAILEYARSIQRVDTSGVTPFQSGGSGHWRDDAPAPSLNRAVVLEQAPGAAETAGLFRVPKVL